MTVGNLIHALLGLVSIGALIASLPRSCTPATTWTASTSSEGRSCSSPVLGSSIARFDEPPNYRQILTFAGQVAWIVSAAKSRKRRETGLRARRERRSSVLPRIPNWLFYVVTLTIVGLWAVGIVLSFASSSFQMPESLNGALPVVLVGIYTTKAASDRRHDEPPQVDRRPATEER